MFNTLTAVPFVIFFVYQAMFASAEIPKIHILMPMYYVQLHVQ